MDNREKALSFMDKFRWLYDARHKADLEVLAAAALSDDAAKRVCADPCKGLLKAVAVVGCRLAA